jgi:hypothetical protein
MVSVRLLKPFSQSQINCWPLLLNNLQFALSNLAEIFISPIELIFVARLTGAQMRGNALIEFLSALLTLREITGVPAKRDRTSSNVPV